MIKIMLTVRNRLAITKKCIQALYKHSSKKFQLYVYDNQTNYLLKEHFNFFSQLYEKELVSQVTFNSDTSTFNAFSKAISCNQFGKLHQQDPEKDKYSFLLFLDNDIIVAPNWDIKILKAWNFVKKAPDLKKNIKVVSQLPGGIKQRQEQFMIDNMLCKTGKLGGSGFWSVKTDFFDDVGFLDVKQLVGHDKKHDQNYWIKMDRATGGKPYILGISTMEKTNTLAYHVGGYAGSVCNRLTRNRTKSKKEKLDSIKFADREEEISKMSFEQFFKMVENKLDWYVW